MAVDRFDHQDHRYQTAEFEAREGEPMISRTLIGLLLSGWALATLASLLLTDITVFLDVPLGAYVAGQGAFLALIVVAVSVAQDSR